jgi:thiopeptide-type bacteriocin biosynthesis protein
VNAGTDETAAPWLAFHIFYAANSNPMLVEGVGPVIARLREQGLLARWFFIRYWMEGPHVRLRVLPKNRLVAAEVRAQVEEALDGFLRRRPALYEADRDMSGELYKRMYLAEYSEEQWNAQYGADGEMPYRDNNRFYEFPYDREYDRYGGPAGMELSEWHFEKSSDIVLRSVAATNVHVRTVLLGQTAQLDMALCYAFLHDEPAVAQFLENYRHFWETSYQEPSTDQHATFERSFTRMRPRLEERLARIRATVRDPDDTAATALEREWAAHCVELRDRATALTEAGRLSFRRGPVSDPAVALPILLSSFVHMTANRIGASILDEIYLSFVNRLAMLSMAGQDSAVAA